MTIKIIRSTLLCFIFGLASVVQASYFSGRKMCPVKTPLHEFMQNEVYPWPSDRWPYIKMYYNYEVDARIEIKDVPDEYARSQQPTFQVYYSHVKVDSLDNIASQGAYMDPQKTELMQEIVVDYEQATVIEVTGSEHGTTRQECVITKFTEGTYITPQQVLQAIWTPTEDDVTLYLGQQCVSEDLQDVHGFIGVDAYGQSWTAFFDPYTLEMVMSQSGSDAPGQQLLTATMRPGSWKQRLDFELDEFKKDACFTAHPEVRMADQPLIPSVDLGFIM